MRKEYLAVEESMIIDGVRITPVVRVSLQYVEIKGACSFYAGKQPVYVVVSSPRGERAYSITGEEVSLRKLAEECPALAAGPV